MNGLPVVVVKVGGSLLDWRELPQRLAAWLRSRPAALHVLVAGGGTLCEFVKQADARFGLGEERAHWLCIDALSISSKLLSHMLSDLPVIDALPTVRAVQDKESGHATCIFDPRLFLTAEEAQRNGAALPHTWDVTTDSIAARLAECLAADLVLLKSCDAPATVIEAASRAGFVDTYFPRAARPLRHIGYVNLRRGNELVTLDWAGR
jgi:aspartokinase-like uncharacterized kinase